MLTGIPKAEFMNVQFLLRFLVTILRVLRLEVTYTNFFITNQFQGGGGVKFVSRDDWIAKRKTLDFCPDYF